MDSLKDKLGGSESPEERKARKRKLLPLNVGSLVISIVMVVIGAQYYDEENCRNEAPLYLLIGGGITVGMTVLKLFAWFTPCECDDKLASFLTPLANLANFCILIWGSVVVFGAYATWQYEDKLHHNFCEYTPFMFAFVLLLLSWVLMPILFCCEIFLCCGAFLYMATVNNAV